MLSYVKPDSDSKCHDKSCDALRPDEHAPMLARRLSLRIGYLIRRGGYDMGRDTY